ncbi:helix-turn-helix domain-containing protein [Nocardia tengchongensis]|uniref:helix-turn-helix domain-containing protein n=1 Tax=Nocardia tengchongensis TaxID=2055889 RepID=UPI00368792A1
MIRGQQLRQLRQSAQLSLDELASRCYLSKSYLGLVETGRKPVTATVIGEYERVLGVRVSDGHDDDVNRRMFLGAVAVAAANASLIGDLGASLAGGDPGPLAIVQTSNAVDHAIAATVDRSVWRKMARWSIGESSAITRVNALGIVAKAPGQSLGAHVVTVLDHDEAVRDLYLAAVAARVLGVDHATAAAYVADPARLPAVQLAAHRFAGEAIVAGDAGARWCAATMLARMAPHIGRR